MKRASAIRVLLYSLGTLLLLTLAAGGYFWFSVQRTMHEMYEPLPSVKWENPNFEGEEESLSPTSLSQKESSSENERREEKEEKPLSPVVPVSVTDERPSEPVVISVADVERLRNPKLSDKEPFTLLLLGVDERPWDRGRSDTMILLTVQPRSGKAVALSIPRDTRVRMPNSGKYDKINHAYAFGGTPLSVEAVERLFGVPVAYYMKTNMEGLVNIVDTVGGVEVDNPRAFDYEGRSFPQGVQHLDGEAALAYSRMRKTDPQGDFGRTQRQRQIVTDAIDRVADVGTLSKLPKLLSHLSEFVRTNLTAGNMANLVMDYRPAIQHVDTLYLQGQGKMIDGIYYYMVTAEERRRIQSAILKCLDAE